MTDQSGGMGGGGMPSWLQSLLGIFSGGGGAGAPGAGGPASGLPNIAPPGPVSPFSFGSPLGALMPGQPSSLGMPAPPAGGLPAVSPAGGPSGLPDSSAAPQPSTPGRGIAMPPTRQVLIGGGSAAPGDKAGTQPAEPPSASGATSSDQSSKLAQSDTSKSTTTPTGSAMPGGPASGLPNSGQLSPAQLMQLAAMSGTQIPKPPQPLPYTGVIGSHPIANPHPAQGAHAAAPAIASLIQALIPGGLGAGAGALSRIPLLGNLLPKR